MLTLISGGSASGKSDYAERLILTSSARPRIYAATMEVLDEESRRRVARHRAMRAERDFVTLECPRDLAGADIPRGSAVLLECMSNLTANECFGPKGFDGAAERILDGVDRAVERACDVVIVTNELFGDGNIYDQWTDAYLKVLGEVNRRIAARADRVVEVVCGLPVCWKGAKQEG